MKLKDKVAIITGAGSGIGRACAILFAQEGARIVAAEVDASAGQSTADTIQEAGGEAAFVETDVAKGSDVGRMVAAALAKWGRIDVLLNAAAILAYGTIVETDEATWERVISINLTGTWRCCKAVVPHMIRQGSGSIINVASTTGAHDACAHAVAYVSSKGGVTLLTRAMAIDHARQGIRVNALCPGPTDTPMLRRALTPAQLEAFAQSFPMGRLGLPEELARAALFLASDDASFVTGSVMYIDGGQAAEV